MMDFCPCGCSSGERCFCVLTSCCSCSPQHKHNFKILATRHNGQLAFEAFLLRKPMYSFKCECGSMAEGNLEKAVTNGWIMVVDF